MSCICEKCQSVGINGSEWEHGKWCDSCYLEALEKEYPMYRSVPKTNDSLEEVKKYCREFDEKYPFNLRWRAEESRDCIEISCEGAFTTQKRRIHTDSFWNKSDDRKREVIFNALKDITNT